MLTEVVVGSDVGQCYCRVVRDLCTWHDVNRTINLPSHRTISALLDGLGRLPYLDGERLSGFVWEGHGVFDDRGEGLVGLLPHPIALGVLVGLPHTVLRVGLPHNLCGISIAVIDIAVTGIAETGIAVTSHDNLIRHPII